MRTWHFVAVLDEMAVLKWQILFVLLVPADKQNTIAQRLLIVTLIY
jgi:hypothetical protein